MRRPREELSNILRDKGCTPFQIEVYRAASAIPWGRTRSYAWVASRIGNPKAARAVGGALKKNPFPLIIPCHRVIREDGAAGGFSCGRGLKKKLLLLEKSAIIR